VEEEEARKTSKSRVWQQSKGCQTKNGKERTVALLFRIPSSRLNLLQQNINRKLMSSLLLVYGYLWGVCDWRHFDVFGLPTANGEEKGSSQETLN
jgi:hypothetical protein